MSVQEDHQDANRDDALRPAPRAERLLHGRVRNPEAISHKEAQQVAQECETDRARMEAENRTLRDSVRQLEHYRDRYVDLYDFAPLGYTTLDEDGFIQEINIAGAKLLGTQRDTVTGYPFAEYVPAEQQAAFREHLRRCVEDREEMTSEFMLVLEGGRAVPVQLRSIPVQDADGATFCKTAITDLTQRKQMEESLRQSREFLRELNETLERRVAERTAVAQRRAGQLRAMAAQLAQAEQRERRRLALILRDHVQQALAAAKMRVDHLREQSRDEELRESLAQVADLLERPLVESRALVVELSPPALYDGSLAAALEWLAVSLRLKHGLEARVEADPRAEPADEGTRVFLFQAVHELLLNVLQHGETSRAEFRLAKADDGRLRVEVHDQGRGFDPRMLEADEIVEGHFGLLAIRERLELLGGRFQIESEPGRGTRVVLLCPPGPPRSPPAADKAAVGESRDEPHGRRATRVLVADDHPMLRRGLADVLREEPRIEVVGEAADGEAAVELAIATQPDVVLMDVSMPKLGGVEATRRIMARLPETRVVGLSGHADDDMGPIMRDAGAAAYLLKSVPAQTLLDAILDPAAAAISPLAATSAQA